MTANQNHPELPEEVYAVINEAMRLTGDIDLHAKLAEYANTLGRTAAQATPSVFTPEQIKMLTSCYKPSDHFRDATKMVPAGEGVELPDAITFLRDNDLAASDDWMQGWNDLRSIMAAEIAKRDAEIAELRNATAGAQALIQQLRAQLAEAQKARCPNLMPVITWLKNGCNVADAITELELYQYDRDAAIAQEGDTNE